MPSQSRIGKNCGPRRPRLIDAEPTHLRVPVRVLHALEARTKYVYAYVYEYVYGSIGGWLRVSGCAAPAAVKALSCRPDLAATATAKV